jgi:hypothetical protein
MCYGYAWQVWMMEMCGGLRQSMMVVKQRLKIQTMRAEWMRVCGF